MTIMVVSFTPKEILFASDTFRYQLTENTSEDVVNHTLEIDEHNLNDHVESYETDCPKIHKITRSTGLICGGDGRFSDIPEGLNKRKNIAKQILQRLEQKGKIKAFWSCHIGRLHNGKITLMSIIYESGNITTKEHAKEDITFDSFASEMKKRFPFMIFYMADTKEKIAIVNEFFEQTTKLYNGLAGGRPQIAILNEKGFQWIHPHDFTTYSLNWCPEKIETNATTEVAWSSDSSWTDDTSDPLHLAFTCESKMILFISVYCKLATYKIATSSGQQIGAQFKLVLDTTDLPVTFGNFANWAPADVGYWVKGGYACHTVVIADRGQHTLKLRVCAIGAGIGATAYFYDRRLSVMMGFYQGGTT